MEQSCCISSLFIMLTRFISEDVCNELIVRTLQVVMSCGTCCCFPPYLLINKLIKIIVSKHGEQKIRNLCLVLLERTCYRQMGIFEEKPSSCELCINNYKFQSINDEIENSSKYNSNSDISVKSYVSNTSESYKFPKNKWSCFELFRDLLLSSNSSISCTVGTHLLRIVPKCSIVVKHEILFGIFHPVFLIIKNRYTKSKSDIDKFLVTTCLSVFTNLLGRVRFIEQFIELKTLDHIIEIMEEKCFMKLCCSIIEIVVIVQVWKLERATTKNNPSILKERSVYELGVLLENVKEISENYLARIQICYKSEQNNEGIEDQLEFESVFSWEAYCQLIDNLNTVWKTCANLSLYSPQIRLYFSAPSTSDLAKSLLLSVLKTIGKAIFIEDNKCKEKELLANQIHLKLLESLLVLCLVSPPIDAVKDLPVTIEVLLNELKPTLLNLTENSSMNMRHLCDMLLRSSFAQPSQQLVLPTHKVPKIGSFICEGAEAALSLAIALNSPDIEDQISDHDSTPDLTADEGYDADVEVLDMVVEQEKESSASTGSLCQSRKISSAMECRRHHVIMHPGLVLLTLDLIVHSTQSCLKSNNKESQLSDCVHCLNCISTMCRDSVENCGRLSQQKLLLRLINDFSEVLTVSNSSLAELQLAVLELITLLARHTIEAQELSQFIQFFISDKPPVEYLLPSLMKLILNCESQPSFIMRFPSTFPEGKMALHSLSTQAEETAVEMRTHHLAAGIQSSWSTCSLALPINTDLGWSMWLPGFSLSLWLRLDKQPTTPWRIPPTLINGSGSDSTQFDAYSDGFSEIWNYNGSYYTTSDEASNSTKKTKILKHIPSRLLHITSVGFSMMVLEIWADTKADTIIIRLIRPELKKQEVLCEAVVEGQLPCGIWHHLAINVKDACAPKRTVIEVTLIINGLVEIKREFSFIGVLLRKPRPSCLLLGHSGPSNGSLYIGNIMMFRTPVFCKESAMCLVAYGPDYNSITQADVGNTLPNFASVLKAKNVSSGLKWQSLLTEQTGLLKGLQENLLLLYSAGNHTTASAYPQVINNSSGVVGSLFPQGPGFRVAAVDNRASQLLPMVLSPVFFAPLSVQHFNGITTAANTIGGLPIFLFLFARVVELECCEESQAQALSLVLKLSRTTCDLYNQFLILDTYKLLRRVITCSKTPPGYHILKVLMDICCDKPGLLNICNKNRFFLNTQAECIIVLPDLLSKTILCSWRDWEPGSYMLQLFQALYILLRDDHPHREFNAWQLNRVHFVNSLLQFCKERFCHGEGLLPLDPAICSSIIELIRSLMGAPPEFSQIVLIFNFLVLIHPAHATYITHVRPSFYFLMSENKYLKRSDIKVDCSEVDSNKVQKNKAELSRRNEDIFNHLVKNNQTIDLSKLNNALTSLQIKQNIDNYNNGIVSKVSSTDSNITSFTCSSGQGSLENLNEWEIIKDVNGQRLSPYTNTKEPSSFETAEMDDEIHEKFTSENTRETVTSGIGSDQLYLRGSSFSTDNGTIDKFEDSQALIVEGLLFLLRDVVLVLPDAMAHEVLSSIIKAEVLLVMANHKNANVRSAVIKLLSAYLQRATEDEIMRFVRMKGFFLLANQLASYSATEDIVDGLVGMATGFHWLPLEKQLENEEIGEVTLESKQLAALIPLLALLPRSVHDSSLTSNILHLLQKLFVKVPQSVRTQMDNGLLEVLCKTLVAVAHTQQEPTNMHRVSEQELLLSRVHGFLVTILSIALNSPGNHNMQVLNDILVLMRYVEKKERLHCGAEANCVLSLRAAQCIILNSTLNLVQDKIISLQQTVASRIRSSATAFLSSVLSPNYEDLLFMESLTTSMSKRSSNADSINSQTSGSNHTSGSSNSSQKSSNKVPHSEIIDRFKIIIMKATEYFIHVDPVEEPYFSLNGRDSSFLCHLFTTLLSCMNVIVDRKACPKSTWSSAVWNCRDIIRNMCGQLFAWMILPGHKNELRLVAIQSIRNLTKVKEIMSSLLLTNNQLEQHFPLFLWELMYGPQSSQLSTTEIKLLEELQEQVQVWGVVSPQAIGHKHDPWIDDAAAVMKIIQSQRKNLCRQQEPLVNRLITKRESVVKVVCDYSLSVTKYVVEAQNTERKALMESFKSSLNDQILAEIQWKSIVNQLTHERAVWHFPKSYPRSWELDPTEGPGRVRIRLQRCHLFLEKRFFKQEFKDKQDSIKEKQPLSYLFSSEGNAVTSMSAMMIERLHLDEKIRHMAAAKIITPAYEVPGELLIGESCLYFVPSNEYLKAEVNSACMDIFSQSQAWHFEDIKEVHNRRIELQERALEIFLLNGKTFLMAFQSSNERDLFSNELSQCNLPHRIASDHLCDAVQLWREGQITNWDYLTTLNKMAGRSYNDLMQYPVMPFVLADYISDVLDLNDPKSFRNFKKPMAVQDKKNENHYIKNYNYLKHECIDAMNFDTLNKEPYHYGSHYSNSGTVLHFLVRMPPFTKMFLTYQDQNFDLPDRTFHSMYTTWRLTSSDSTTDVKELLPEFFYLPEFLTNAEGFNFGQRQNGLRVDDVGLPTWALNDPRRFILIHRQALESDFVRENLPHWIDLVFGYKQTGKAAVESINVFHPATYYGFDVESISDPMKREAWETMVRTFGQTPRQLFRAAHPMVIQSLTPKPASPPVIKGVKGLSWGNYVGSPADRPPTIIWQQQHRTPVATLIPLLTNDVFGLAPKTTLLLAYSKEKTVSLVSTGGTCVLGAALISWGHSDGIIRAKLKKEQPPYPALRPQHCGGSITICTSVPDCNQLWIGYDSGKILVYRYEFKPSRGVMEFLPDPVVLLGHPTAVLTITLSRAFSIAISGSIDGSAILWDLNRLMYIRSLPTISLPLNLTCVSETSGDLVTIGHDVENGGSTVRVHSINVVLVGSFTTREQITSVCFSMAPEGVSVNVVATGMADGTIRLWSSWDLAPVGNIIASPLHPVISLTYSHDSQHLYATLSNGSVIIWEGSSTKGASKTPKFLNLTTLI
uniref:Lysosomal-trafficking regulator n=1 Tax=Clastoptera arizonana TaxID=38151 RepID=A0A1B6DVR8_9HEMI